MYVYIYIYIYIYMYTPYAVVVDICIIRGMASLPFDGRGTNTPMSACPFLRTGRRP